MAASHKIFTAEEKRMVIDLVGRFPFLEEKRTDVMSLSKKKKVWEDITAAFNANAEVTKRTTGQLKKCWVNMKSRRKKELADEAGRRMATGGGGPCHANAGSFPDMEAVAPHITHHGVFLWDSDAAAVEEGNAVINEDGPSAVQEDSYHNSGEREILYEMVTPKAKMRDKRVSSKPFNRRSLLEREISVRLRRANAQEQQEEQLFRLKLEEHRYLVELAKERIRLLKEKETRKKLSYEEEEERRRISFAAEERRKEEMHVLQMSKIKKK